MNRKDFLELINATMEGAKNANIAAVCALLIGDFEESKKLKIEGDAHAKAAAIYMEAYEQIKDMYEDKEESKEE